MPRTLSDEDCDAIIQKLFERLARCLEIDRQNGFGIARNSPVSAVKERQAASNSISENMPNAKLAYSKKEVCELLGISTVTLWRLELRGLIHSVPGIRRKIYGRSEVDRFLKATAVAKPR